MKMPSQVCEVTEHVPLRLDSTATAPVNPNVPAEGTGPLCGYVSYPLDTIIGLQLSVQNRRLKWKAKKDSIYSNHCIL